jgi:hypothetical protein
MKLENNPALDVNGISIPDIFHSLIIGPTQFQATIADAIIDELIRGGVPDAKTKILFSDIPLRV